MSNIQYVRSIISKAGKQVFGIKFIKKDGSERVMSARIGVKKHLRGGMDSTAKRKDLLNVFDMNVAEYRKIPLDRVVSVTVGGVVYNV